MTITPVDSAIEFASLPAKQNSEIELVESLVSRFGAPLMVLDCNSVRKQYRALQAALPNVTLHFALKPLPHPAVVRTLLAEGASFDLATSGEIDIVAAEGVPAGKTIHSHPIKRDRDIRDALDYGCNVFVVDNMNELEKFIPYAEQAKIFLITTNAQPS